MTTKLNTGTNRFRSIRSRPIVGRPAPVRFVCNASILRNNRVVFNICGNKYRIVVLMDYTRYGMLIRFVGTHEEYDEIGDIEHI
ncbi:MAG: type II toxin-antitoxin system HigB family toxin [Proteobacteria bacterium]|nr:type II toxin-antitoxin system HigB family toxin [Pseudomonadota bacterium]